MTLGAPAAIEWGDVIDEASLEHATEDAMIVRTRRSFGSPVEDAGEHAGVRGAEWTRVVDAPAHRITGTPCRPG